MKVKFSQEFYQIYKKKIDVRIRKSVNERLEIFRKNPSDSILDNHELEDEWAGHRSIDITGDYRAIYEEIIEGEDIVAYFVTLGTHEALYREVKSGF